MAPKKIDQLAKDILEDVLADFRSKNLTLDELSTEYEGPSIASLENKYCAQGGSSNIDFDLAIKELETAKLINTGPLEPFENDPNSGVAVFGLFSKREFLYLTEKGYKKSQESVQRPMPRSPSPTVHISGGNFQNSPLAIGENISQTTTINIKNDAEVIGYLVKLHAGHDPASGEKEKQEIIHLVDAAKAGDLPRAKPIFQHLFGAAKETVKGLAWAVIAELLKAQLGI